MEVFKSILSTGVADTVALYSSNETLCAIVALLCYLISIASAYFIGSINFAIILSNKRGDDIRNYGSQNAGTTNMLRTYGKRAAVLTLVGDFLKGTVAVLIGLVLAGVYGQYLAALFAVVGHVFPIYYKFKGGKGIATAAGTILACEPIVLLILIIAFAVVVGFTKYVSLASIMVAMLYPLLLDRYYKFIGAPSGLHILCVVILSCIVLWKHYPNMQRLLNKTESKISFKKKSSAEAKPSEKEDRGEDK